MFSFYNRVRFCLSLRFIFYIGLLSLISACGEPKNSQDADTKAGTSSSDASNSASANDAAAYAQTEYIEPSSQRSGNPEAGRHALLHEPIVSCGIPVSAFSQVVSDVKYPISGREGEAAKLPYNLNLVTDNNGVKLAASNCLSCHGAPLFGELVVGLGNEFFDYTSDPSIAVEQIGTLVTGNNETAAWEKFADRIGAIAPYMQMQTAGVNPANNLTFALMAYRDPKTMQWQDEPLSKPPSTTPPPVSVPPWWRMKKKHAMFSMGEGRGDHGSIMIAAAILCADSIDEVEQLDAIAPDIRAFISSIEAPVYPFAIDQALANDGEQLFEQTCSQCHGTYGDDPTYPNRVVEIDVVNTDSSLIDYAFGDGQTYVDWFNQSPLGKKAKAVPSRGYVAPPLDGIWATGPFLHNGSVPTIRAVLDSSTRPTLWHHSQPGDTSETNFDQDDLGWGYASLNEDEKPGEVSSLDGVGAQWIYDTRLPGYTNTGHIFGDALTTDQRNAVLEYLKTL